MTSDSYRTAYETALAEVTEIAAKFEQLRLRKSQIENLIAALQPIFGEAKPEGESSSAEREGASASQPEGSASYSYLEVPNPLPEGDGDPFQRRIKSNFRFRGLATQRS
jgi:hypothetical protein